ncbi:MAG TPA: 30S ribosomal protein S3 [Candidatus Saccharimonadales bacterium]|nr:30S ribosomal protein S3 [Candidatus Saccharimonadales bacterium]
MGQKVNPRAFRLSINKDWDSKWFASKTRYRELLAEDIKMRGFVMKKLKGAGVSRVVIERSINKVVVNVLVSRPGMVIGRSGAGIEELKKELEALTNQKITINVEEIKRPDLNAHLVAQNIADQIERRFPVKRLMIQSAERVMRSGARGVKIICAGRIGGSEIARVEKRTIGSLPLQTLRADIDYAAIPAKTQTAGVTGVKVWIYKPEKTEGVS